MPRKPKRGRIPLFRLNRSLFLTVAEIAHIFLSLFCNSARGAELAPSLVPSPYELSSQWGCAEPPVLPAPSPAPRGASATEILGKTPLPWREGVCTSAFQPLSHAKLGGFALPSADCEPTFHPSVQGWAVLLFAFAGDGAKNSNRPGLSIFQADV